MRNVVANRLTLHGERDIITTRGDIMDNQRLILDAMLRMEERLTARMDKMDARFDAVESIQASTTERIDALQAGMVEMFRDQSAAMRDYIDKTVTASEQRSALLIENTITKRLDTLTDGYQSNAEKLWTLTRTVEKLDERVTALESRGA